MCDLENQKMCLKLKQRNQAQREKNPHIFVVPFGRTLIQVGKEIGYGQCHLPERQSPIFPLYDQSEARSWFYPRADAREQVLQNLCVDVRERPAGVKMGTRHSVNSGSVKGRQEEHLVSFSRGGDFALPQRRIRL